MRKLSVKSLTRSLGREEFNSRMERTEESENLNVDYKLSIIKKQWGKIDKNEHM